MHWASLFLPESCDGISLETRHVPWDDTLVPYTHTNLHTHAPATWLLGDDRIQAEEQLLQLKDLAAEKKLAEETARRVKAEAERAAEGDLST